MIYRKFLKFIFYIGKGTRNKKLSPSEFRYFSIKEQTQSKEDYRMLGRKQYCVHFALSNFNHSTPYGAMENSWCLKETRNYCHMLLYNSLINCIYQNHHCLKSITYMCL